MLFPSMSCSHKPSKTTCPIKLAPASFSLYNETCRNSNVRLLNFTSKDGMYMESAAIHSAKHLLLMIGIILGAGMFSEILAQKLKIPDVVVLLLLGIGLGPEIAGVID